MFTFSVLLVMASGLIHAVWNLFAKRSVHKAVFLWFCQWTAILVFLPLTLRELIHAPAVPPAGWLFLGASIFLHGIYVVLLAKTYSVGDLSQAYPIMRGTSPLLVPAGAVLLLHEDLRWTGWLGIACIVGGILLLGNFNIRSFAGGFNKTLGYALSVGVMITCYSLADKVALRYVPPFSLNEATNIGNLLALTSIALRSGAVRAEWRINWRTIILGGILAPGGYLLFLYALRDMPASRIAPMREIGTVFAVLLGIFVLREPQGRGRIAASALVVSGIILLA